MSRWQVFLLPDYLAITMEFAAGGDLFQLVGRAGGLREEDAKWYFQQLIVAIDYCHRMVRVVPHRAAFARVHGHSNHVRLSEPVPHPDAG